ncbi:DEAD/DEAH box helicase family protein [Clostridium chrysemydis]|uniref:DEAD/DEAH box helicase family protein n=1 Tax=Clostridium chrysemydis TaxID=2665504 RepID=UPI001884453D|nr:DEAD/DEAH box helicase family protein [Clostridium chrysemydis]
MIGLPKGLFEFQDECVNYLLEATSISSKKTTVVKAPTGAGKTIILLDYIDKYINNVNSNVSFVWFCPGKGNLEEQSQKKMKKHLPNRKSKNLQDAISVGFQSRETTFINWELVTNKNNKAVTETEWKNLFGRIAEAHRKGVEFILIIDEEHSNDTQKAKDIINSFAASYQVRVSATARENKLHNFYEIPEVDVINSGLITRALYINEGVEGSAKIDNEHSYLIELANNKRKEIAKEYENLDVEIRPLVLIQFPDMSDELITSIEETLDSMGYNYDNKLVAKWMSDNSDKINKEGIEKLDAQPVFLLMKQAVATGWDCPRAKILIKLRENMSEDFTIQTIGRLRRMPEAIHYENEILDNCYLYTFDEKYKESIRKEISNAFDVKRVFLKEKCKTFTLEKQMKDLDYDGIGERETYRSVFEFFNNKYNLSTAKANNKLILEAEGYSFTEELVRTARQGKFIKTDSILDSHVGSFIQTRREVNTHKNGIDLLHSIDTIKSAIGIKQGKLRAILERLFRDNSYNRDKLLNLNTKQFYAFVINNEHKLKEDFREATSQLASQVAFPSIVKTREFKIPERDLVKYDASETDVIEMLSNAYHEYPSSTLVDGIRSRPERLFERYCEDNDNIDWVYNNGDKGQEYFSIVYYDSFERKQWLFYPDYIVKLKNGDVWIIETKGGERKDGKSNNLDRQVANKFEAFKTYANDKNIKWGFVRDKNDILKINNTVYTESMSSEHWKPITTAF